MIQPRFIGMLVAGFTLSMYTVSKMILMAMEWYLELAMMPFHLDCIVGSRERGLPMAFTQLTSVEVEPVTCGLQVRRFNRYSTVPP